MNVVEPIREPEKIEEIHHYLASKDSKEAKRNALIFSFRDLFRIEDFRYFIVSRFRLLQ